MTATPHSRHDLLPETSDLGLRIGPASILHGLGAQPPAPSWGKMLKDAQTLMYLAPQLAIFPGAAILLSVLGLNLLGDGLRDILDSKLVRVQ